MSVSIEQCQKQEKSRLAACRQSWIFLVFDRAKAREREGAKQLPACTAELDRDRTKAREQEGAKQLPACTAKLDRDRAKAREQEGAKQLPACTAKLERDRAKAREREQRKVEKKKRKQVITCELEWDMMFIN